MDLTKSHEVKYFQKNEVEVLMEAMSLLTASIIRSQDEQDQEDQGVQVDQREGDDAAKEDFATVLLKSNSNHRNDIDQRLEQLQNEWKLEETGFCRLYNTCMQMKQCNKLAIIEADQVVKDVNKANYALLGEREKVHKLQLEVERLQNDHSTVCAKYNMLQEKYKKCKEEKSFVINYFKKVARAWRKEREDMKYEYKTEVTKVQTVHRECTDGSESIATTATSTSLITDDGCATLRLEKSEKPKSLFSKFI